jgi:hypothetical protein
MTWTNILAEFYYLTRTTSSQHTESDLLRGINEYQKQLILQILKVVVDKNTTLKESYTNLVSTTGLSSGNNGYNGEYAFPTTLLKPLKIDISYDGTNWETCSEYDITENKCIEHDATSIAGAFSTGSPFVRYERDSYFIRPLPSTTVANGIHIYYEARQAELTTGTDVPSISEDFHQLFPLKLAERWGMKNPEKYNIMWSQEVNRIERELKEFYKNRFKRNFQLKPIQINYK